MTDFHQLQPVLKVIGLGGAGGNAVNRMAEMGLRDVELIAANTDAQALQRSSAHVRIQLGTTLTSGLGAGSDPAKGRLAALDSKEDLREVLHGSHLVFITAGMGGGTGTGASPIAAQVAKDAHALTIGVVTRPFDFEGRVRAEQAEEGIKLLRECVDTLLIIPNDRLLLGEERLRTVEAFRKADDVLRQAVQSISEVITQSGDINMDLNDIRAVMTGAGEALIGIGEASGSDRAVEAARLAVSSPLLENVTVDGAKGLIVNIVGSRESMMMAEMEATMKFLQQAASHDARIKMGHVYDDALGDRLRVTVIATGFPRRGAARSGHSLGRLTGAVLPPAARTEAGRPAPAAPAQPDDLSKPAFLRWKVRKLR